ncbi:MAG TPA: ATP-dependent helicase, partial [Thermoanaerobaculia bacterium]|nr:ATP-dependent helicase [Thermoanaerobaculia bacterium]
VVDYLLREGFLHEDSGLLGLGPEGDRRFRGQGFLELLSVFDSPPLVRVLHGRTELGWVDEATFQLQGGEKTEKTGGETLLLLGGRSWRAVHVDWAKREAYVEAIELPGRSLWLGGGVPLGFTLCQAHKRVLLGESPDDLLTRRAKDQMEEIRGRFQALEPGRTTLERVSTGRVRWWTFAGLKANATLADHLAATGLPVASRDNLGLSFESAGLVPLQAHLPTPDEAGALRPVSLADEALESLKLAFCTPPDLCLGALRRRLSDTEGVRETVVAPVVTTGQV